MAVVVWGLALTAVRRIKNRHNERPGDLLPQWREGANPETDDEKVRSMLRRAAAETMVASSGDVVEGEERAWADMSWDDGADTRSQRTTISSTRTMSRRTVTERARREREREIMIVDDV